VPVADMLGLHDRTGRNWRRIPPEQIAYITANRPFVRRRAGLRFPAVDNKWYVTEYSDAALEIAEGWYDDPQHHFEAIGQARAYVPARTKSMLRPLYDDWALAGQNLALGRPATQSSVAEAPATRTPEADAAGAVNGSFVERYGFHTQEEDQPWWQVDLEALSVIEAVIVFNRVDHPVIAIRATPLRILLSADAATWTVAYETETGFGGLDGHPLFWRPSDRTTARYVRLQAVRRTILHLVEVEVFGIQADPGGARVLPQG
jgi:hypothetical protein